MVETHKTDKGMFIIKLTDRSYLGPKRAQVVYDLEDARTYRTLSAAEKMAERMQCPIYPDPIIHAVANVHSEFGGRGWRQIIG